MKKQERDKQTEISHSIHIEPFVLCLMALLVLIFCSMSIRDSAIEAKKAVQEIYHESDTTEQTADK